MKKENSNEFPLLVLTDLESSLFTSIRGSLCAIVFIIHFFDERLMARIEFSKIFENLIGESYIAVQLFFSISGFLILHSFIKLAHKKTPQIWLVYSIKRFFRIMPAWAAALIFFSLQSASPSLSRFFSDLFFLWAFMPYRLIDLTATISWSLSIEEMFYFSFPFFVFIYRRNMFFHATMFFLIGSACVKYFYTLPPEFFYFHPLNTFQYFFYGMLAYFFFPLIRGLKISNNLFLAFAFLFLFLFSLFPQKWLFIEPLVIFLFCFVSNASGLLAKVFIWLFHRLGRYCFSFYLIHMLAISQSKKFIYLHFPQIQMGYGLIACLGIAFLLSYIYALMLYYLVEDPGIQFGQTIIKLLQKSKKFQI